MPSLRILLALLFAAVLAIPIAGADAQDPKPTPCNGLLLKDGKGDQDVAPVGGGGAGLPHSSVGPDNIDIRGLFFNMVPGADGKPVLTANIQITNLTKDVPPEAHEGEVRYLVDFGTLGNVAYLTAILGSDGWRFVYGEFTDLPDPLGGVTIIENETKGAAFEGPDGVIQIEMPASAGVQPGTEMTGVITRVSLGDNTVIFVSDQAPDGGTADAVTFKVQMCPAAPAPSGSGSGSDSGGGTTPPPSGGGGGGGGGSQPPAQQPQAGQPGPNSLPVAGPLEVSVAVDKGKRATARKRGLRARVRCSVQCRATAVASVSKKVARQLKLGRKATKIGTGKATIVQPGRIPFFIKMTKKAKKALARKGVRKFSLNVAFKVTDLQGKQPKTAKKKSTLR